MRRRDFLRTSGAAAALALMAPRRARAGPTDAVADRLWVFVDANGAWDPTFFCDPKPVPGFVNPDVFTTIDVKTNAKGVSYAPYLDGEPYGSGPGGFFVKHADRLLVINGLDGQTNNHGVGSRNIWTGKLGEGNPCLAGLIAAAHVGEKPKDLPLAFLSTGGYDRTLALVPATRTTSTKPLIKLTFTNRQDVTDPDTWYHHPEVLAAITAKQDERTARLIEEQGLPQIKAGLQRLSSAREAEAALGALMGPLNDTTLLPEVDTSTSPLLPPARIAMAAMAANICVCANLSMRGFDSHANHDDTDPKSSGQRPRLKELFAAIDYVWEKAEVLGFADRLVVVVASEFGRTRYNVPATQAGDSNAKPGKDHWPITSLMLMGADIPPGVIGLTEIKDGVSGVVARHVAADGNEVAVSDSTDPATTTLIRQVHVHHPLRCLAGIKNHPLSERYPVHRLGDFPLPILPDAPGWESFS